MSGLSRATRGLTGLLGSLGRAALTVPRELLEFLRHVSGVWHLTLKTLYYSSLGPLTGRSKLRQQLFLMMRKAGVQSFPIVALISFLMGAILILQAGEPLKRFGQLQEAPGAVALSLTREISPLLTSIVMTARVGASFTAVLASMRINQEILALETMAIHPVGYLVAPRFLSTLVMLPCLTLMAYVIGMLGAAFVAELAYEIPYFMYYEKTLYYLNMSDVCAGLLKAAGFSCLMSLICCYFGLITTGGSVGLGRSIMVAMVSTLVSIIIADAVLTAFINNYIL